MGVSLYNSTFSRTVCRLYGGAIGLVMWYSRTSSPASRESPADSVPGTLKDGRSMAAAARSRATSPAFLSRWTTSEETNLRCRSLSMVRPVASDTVETPTSRSGCRLFDIGRALMAMAKRLAATTFFTPDCRTSRMLRAPSRSSFLAAATAATARLLAAMNLAFRMDHVVI